MRPKKGNVALTAFGHSLRAHRNAANLSLEELAHRAGLNSGYLGTVERGEKNISLLKMLMLCEALELPPTLLVAVLDGLAISPSELRKDKKW